MDILSCPMGMYQTNCYLVTVNDKTLIIDPGVGAVDWVLENAKNPIAILNTHGHFDHVWSNAEIKERLNIPIYCPKKDIFMLSRDPLGNGMPPSKADIEVDGDKVLDIEGIEVIYRHFPGHTPGCSVIEIGDSWFSGDFIFKNSIGRWDFPYSSAEEMYDSLKRVQNIKGDYRVFPGHGEETTLQSELKHINYWLFEVSKRR